MKKTLLLSLLCAASQLFIGCKKDADEVQPASYDALAMATGHWEWDRSTVGFSGNRTPATTGYTRQLVFDRAGRLVVRRSGQSPYYTTYQLSMGQSKYCNLPGVNMPLITYVSEPGIPNNDVKIYRVTQNRDGSQTLAISGEAACVDGGAYEDYHWVAE